MMSYNAYASAKLGWIIVSQFSYCRLVAWLVGWLVGWSVIRHIHHPATVATFWRLLSGIIGWILGVTCWFATWSFNRRSQIFQPLDLAVFARQSVQILITWACQIAFFSCTCLFCLWMCIYDMTIYIYIPTLHIYLYMR